VSLPDTPAADAALADRCRSNGEYLSGLLATGMLQTVGTPDRLPQLLFPHIDPTIVTAIWDRALAVGYRAGRLSVRPRFTPDLLHRIHTQLDDAGHTAMGSLAHRSATTQQPHPADREQTDTWDGGHPQ
jgi:hypothetical protein